jgi:ATP-dependent DNA ligase
LLAYKKGSDVRLYSRNRLEKELPEVSQAVARLPIDDTILDGELTWSRAGAAFHVFDVLWLNGQLVTAKTTEERRALLRELPLRAPLQRVEALEEDRPWERACSEGWEGVIAKRRDAPYEHRRSKNWLKMKCEATHDFVVGGFTDPQGGRVGLGALLVGFYENDDFVFAGKVGTGFDTNLLLDLRARLDAIEIPKPPFTKAVGLPRVRAHWVHPEITVQVAFIEWTAHRKLRHSRLLRVMPQ